VIAGLLMMRQMGHLAWSDVDPDQRSVGDDDLVEAIPGWKKAAKYQAAGHELLARAI
jgi:hypothetical protein